MPDKHEHPTPLTDLLTALWRRKWIVAAVATLAVVASVVASERATEQYSATAALLFLGEGVDQAVFGASATPVSKDPAREAATHVEVVSLAVEQGTVRSLVAQELGITQAAVTHGISIAPQGLSDVVTIKATTPEAAESARLANAFTLQFVRYQSIANQGRVETALNDVRQRIETAPAGTAALTADLRRQERRLNALASLQSANVEVEQDAAVPSSPSCPQPTRSAAFSLIAGLILGALLALIVDRLDARARTEQDIRASLGARTIGLLPERKSLRSRQAFLDAPADTGVEATHSLRTNLRVLDPEHRMRVLILTSATVGEGKSTVSWSLATATAQTGSRVLLMEADLREPNLADLVGFAPTAGLSSLLTGRSVLADALIEVPVGRAGDGSPQVLHVLPAGARPADPAALLESAAMMSLLTQLRATYDRIYIDTPPATLVSDATSLASRADGVIVVSRVGVSRRRCLGELRDSLSALGIATVGVVVNGSAPIAAYGGGTTPRVRKKRLGRSRSARRRPGLRNA